MRRALLLAVTLLLFPAQTHARCSELLNRDVLDRSLELGTAFLLNNQRTEGNFYYQYNWRNKSDANADSQVRQAGAVWGLALVYAETRQPKVRRALTRAFNFFDRHSRSDGARRFVAYPGARSGQLGTVALLALAAVDLMRVEPSTELRQRLDSYVAMLRSAIRDDGRFHASYRADGTPFGPASPYYDGEALLALVKVARFVDPGLQSVAMSAARAGYEFNVRRALADDPDSGTTKGYYQWSSMAYAEIAQSGWADAEAFGTRLLELADWMIDVHRTLHRTRNTAYAYEGIIPAYALARRLGDTARMDKFGCTIDQGLERLTTWQVGSPISIVPKRAAADPRALGGVQNHRREPGLRIDVAQHQMHAVILARRHFLR